MTQITSSFLCRFFLIVPLEKQISLLVNHVIQEIHYAGCACVTQDSALFLYIGIDQTVTQYHEHTNDDSIAGKQAAAQIDNPQAEPVLPAGLPVDSDQSVQEHRYGQTGNHSLSLPDPEDDKTLCIKDRIIRKNDDIPHQRHKEAAHTELPIKKDI